MLETIRIVLVATTHPGNIGAAARAMKTMGLRDLALVQPRQFPCAEATARAAGADDLLMAAKLCDSLEQAVQDCGLVIGTSARERRIAWPELSPRQSAAKIFSTPTPAALVFGREHAGLTNEELEHCQYLVRIPANPDFSSLNLASAVQVLCYELRCAWEETQAAPPQLLLPTEQAASAGQMEEFYTHLERVLIQTDFLDPLKPRRLMRRLRRLFSRAAPNVSEYNILRGILTAVEEKIE